MLGIAGMACAYGAELIKHPQYNSTDDYTRRYAYMPQEKLGTTSNSSH